MPPAVFQVAQDRRKLTAEMWTVRVKCRACARHTKRFVHVWHKRVRWMWQNEPGGTGIWIVLVLSWWTSLEQSRPRRTVCLYAPLPRCFNVNLFPDEVSDLVPCVNLQSVNNLRFLCRWDVAVDDTRIDFWGCRSGSAQHEVRKGLAWTVRTRRGSSSIQKVKRWRG